MTKKNLSEKQKNNLRIHNEKQKLQRYLKRFKTCSFCQEEYYDNTKRIVGKTCSKKCAILLGIQTRNQNNSYVVTKEHAEKISQCLKRLRKEGKIITSEETKKKSSKSLKSKWASGYMAKKIKETCLKKYGVEHYMMLEHYKEQTRQKHKGKTVSNETLEKMSIVSRNQKHRFSRCKGGYRKDLEQYFRSSWEANFARLLNYNNITWEYETNIFNLELGKSYTPDFFLPRTNTFVEIKGWETYKYKEKIKLFKEKNPNVRLITIKRKQYKKLNYKYRDIITTWEKSK